MLCRVRHTAEGTSAAAAARRRQASFLLIHKPEQADDLSKDLDVVHDDRVHRRIFRLQADVAGFFIEGL